MNILIIEDNKALVNQISEVLCKYMLVNTLDVISTYEEYLSSSLDYHHYDIILLDVMIPGASTRENNGIDIAEHIRNFHREIPIIVMSGISDLVFLERSFERGVNDYIIKPFRPRELQIRLFKWYQSYLCSLHFHHNNILHYYELDYSIGENQFYIEGNIIHLTKKSKYLLLLLFTKSEELILSDFLVMKIRNSYNQKIYKENNLRILLLRLKKVLEEHEIASRIVTIRGEGYILRKYKK